MPRMFSTEWCRSWAPSPPSLWLASLWETFPSNLEVVLGWSDVDCCFLVGPPLLLRGLCPGDFSVQPGSGAWLERCGLLLFGRASFATSWPLPSSSSSILILAKLGLRCVPPGRWTAVPEAWQLALGGVEGTALVALSGDGQWQMALTLLTQLVQGRIQADLAAYSSSMCSIGFGSAWHCAVQLLRGLEQRRYHDVLCLSSAITACDAADRWRGALQMLWQAAGTRETSLDAMAYRVACRALDEVSENPRRWRLVLGLFDDLQELSFEADLAMHTTATRCCEDVDPAPFPAISAALLETAMDAMASKNRGGTGAGFQSHVKRWILPPNSWNPGGASMFIPRFRPGTQVLNRFDPLTIVFMLGKTCQQGVSSVTEAVDRLNSGKAKCSDGLCIVRWHGD
eukprot:s1133_g19.t1